MFTIALACQEDPDFEPDHLEVEALPPPGTGVKIKGQWYAVVEVTLRTRPSGPPGTYYRADLVTMPNWAQQARTGLLWPPDDPRHDVLLPSGIHLYWSTHCRHAGPDPAAPGHAACTATELAPGVPRRPAQCKTCGAPCRCPCHIQETTA